MTSMLGRELADELARRLGDAQAEAAAGRLEHAMDAARAVVDLWIEHGSPQTIDDEPEAALDDWAIGLLGDAVPGVTVTCGHLLALGERYYTLASAVGTAYVAVTDAEIGKLNHADGLPLLLVEKWMAFAGEGSELWDALANARVEIAKEADRRRVARFRIGYRGDEATA